MPIEMTDLDRRIWREELEAFVPQRLFDVHVHLSAPEHDLAGADDENIGRPGEWAEEDLLTIDRADADRVYTALFPGREVHYAGMGWPFPKLDFDGANAFVASEMADDPVTPDRMALTQPNPHGRNPPLE